ncbi:MAG: hypothetical protein PF503_19335 [Desulfobacula sp.]|jgi:TusA-related sulfurtransferase|nr:hypothetical protein [Desulfobacula sp.]
MNGLEKAGKKIKHGRCLLITGNLAIPQDMVPEWVEVRIAYEWLLQQDHLAVMQ